MTNPTSALIHAVCYDSTNALNFFPRLFHVLLPLHNARLKACKRHPGPSLGGCFSQGRVHPEFCPPQQTEPWVTYPSLLAAHCFRRLGTSRKGFQLGSWRYLHMHNEVFWGGHPSLHLKSIMLHAHSHLPSDSDSSGEVKCGVSQLQCHGFWNVGDGFDETHQPVE